MFFFLFLSSVHTERILQKLLHILHILTRTQPHSYHKENKRPSDEMMSASSVSFQSQSIKNPTSTTDAPKTFSPPVHGVITLTPTEVADPVTLGREALNPNETPPVGTLEEAESVAAADGGTGPLRTVAV